MLKLQPGDTVALVACSNALRPNTATEIHQLIQHLAQLGLKVQRSPYLYGDSIFATSAQLRAQTLMDAFVHPEVKAIFDLSGGDLANGVLPYLDFDLLAQHPTPFVGYSDLTTLINAIYSQTQQPTVLYQLRQLVGPNKEQQQRDFYASAFEQQNNLYQLAPTFIQGQSMSGILVGGNIRCLLKLAGTPYWPDMREKILLLEAMSGDAAKMATYLSQLQHMGVFEQISGLVLGTFSELDRQSQGPTIEELVQDIAPAQLPIARTQWIGHGADSHAVVIGQWLELTSQDERID